MFDLILQKKTAFGFEAWQLQNDRLSVTVVPAVGGKVISLYDRLTGMEWLVQPEQANAFVAPEYGSSYAISQSGGWDEMIPTITACSYPVMGEHFGTNIPDHGELWTIPWRVKNNKDHAIQLVADGVALPYRLYRTLTFRDENTLRFDYLLQNLGNEKLAYIWTPHPQIRVEPGSTIELPQDVDEVVNVLPGEWGDSGVRNSWPVTHFGKAGTPRRQDIIVPPLVGTGRKFYVPPEQSISWVKIHQPNGASLLFTWDSQKQPYCGIWIDEGLINSIPTVAIEPATGYYDDLSLAWSNRKISLLPTKGEQTWHLEVTILS